MCEDSNNTLARLQSESHHSKGVKTAHLGLEQIPNQEIRFLITLVIHTSLKKISLLFPNMPATSVQIKNVKLFYCKGGHVTSEFRARTPLLSTSVEKRPPGRRRAFVCLPRRTFKPHDSSDNSIPHVALMGWKEWRKKRRAALDRIQGGRQHRPDGRGGAAVTANVGNDRRVYR